MKAILEKEQPYLIFHNQPGEIGPGPLKTNQSPQFIHLDAIKTIAPLQVEENNYATSSRLIEAYKNSK